MRGAQKAQPSNRNRAAGGAVSVEIGHHEDAFVVCESIHQQPDRVVHAGEHGRRMQLLQAIVQLRHREHVACCQHSRDNRMHALGQIRRHWLRVATGNSRGHGIQPENSLRWRARLPAFRAAGKRQRNPTRDSGGHARYAVDCRYWG